MGIPPYNELKTISSGLVVAVFSECLLIYYLKRDLRLANAPRTYFVLHVLHAVNYTG